MTAEAFCVVLDLEKEFHDLTIHPPPLERNAVVHDQPMQEIVDFRAGHQIARFVLRVNSFLHLGGCQQHVFFGAGHGRFDLTAAVPQFFHPFCTENRERLYDCRKFIPQFFLQKCRFHVGVGRLEFGKLSDHLAPQFAGIHFRFLTTQTVRIRYRVMGRADSQSKRSRFIGRGQRGRIAIICFNLFIRPRIVPHEMVAVSVAGYEPFVGHAVQGLETGLRFILAVGLYLADLVIDVFLARQSAFEGFAGQALQVVACIGDMVCPRHAVTEPPDGLHDLGLRVYCRKGGTHYIREQDYMGFVV